MRQSATRYHDFSCGHRVHNHESKCAYLHGHNYRVTFFVQGELDAVGRVMDFSVIKSKLCQWLEDHWDHKFLAWEDDPVMKAIWDCSDFGSSEVLIRSIVWVDFNPTAENMAGHLLNVIGPKQLNGSGCTLTKVIVEETRKCAAEAAL